VQQDNSVMLTGVGFIILLAFMAGFVIHFCR
jgi:hypothetical protein